MKVDTRCAHHLALSERLPGTDIHLIDTLERGWSRRTVVYAIDDADSPVLVDVGPASSLSTVLAGLRALGLLNRDPSLHVVVTHAHLDHCGGAGMLACYGNLDIHMTPRAGRVAADPVGLFESTTQVLGGLAAAWGAPMQIPPSRLRDLTGLPQRLISKESEGHCPGHAMIFDDETGTLFSGDELGVAYPSVESGQVVVLPCTPPTRADIGQILDSLDWARSLAPARIAFSHGGWSASPNRCLEGLERILTDSLVAPLSRSVGGDNPKDQLRMRLWNAALRVHNLTDAQLAAHNGLAEDLDASSAGMLAWMERTHNGR